MKNFQLPRYKIIIQTVIGQKLEQLLRITSRCLWDPKTDNMLSVNYESKDMVAVVTVYAVYLDWTEQREETFFLLNKEFNRYENLFWLE